MRSTEEVAQILISLLDFGLFLLLGLLFFGGLLLFFFGFASSRSNWSTSSDSLGTLSDQLMERFSLQSLDNSVEFVVVGVGLDAGEDCFEIFGG
jgi:hypothetical protein